MMEYLIAGVLAFMLPAALFLFLSGKFEKRIGLSSLFLIVGIILIAGNFVFIMNAPNYVLNSTMIHNDTHPSSQDHVEYTIIKYDIADSDKGIFTAMYRIVLNLMLFMIMFILIYLVLDVLKFFIDVVKGGVNNVRG